jgi:hypothetical protein
MAVLSTADRNAVSADYQRDISVQRVAMGALVKADIQAAVNATDQWIEDNSVAFNLALPLPARTILTAQQKVEIFLRVLHRRVKGD